MAGVTGDVLARYEHGPDASVRAFAGAWARLRTARTVVLVEGVSDQIAVESAAEVLGAELAGVVVVPMNGAQAIGRVLADVDAQRPAAKVVVLCDAAERAVVERARSASLEPARVRVVACVPDLEFELVRAAGEPLVRAVLTAGGDAGAFRTLQRQAAWRDRPFDEQSHRFLRAGARRSQRYADALVRALGPRRLPAPLIDVVTSLT